jgi:hypothetical protein
MECRNGPKIAQIALLERFLEGFEDGLEVHVPFWNWFEGIEFLKCGDRWCGA